MTNPESVNCPECKRLWNEAEDVKTQRDDWRKWYESQREAYRKCVLDSEKRISELEAKLAHYEDTLTLDSFRELQGGLIVKAIEPVRIGELFDKIAKLEARILEMEGKNE